MREGSTREGPARARASLRLRCATLCCAEVARRPRWRFWGSAGAARRLPAGRPCPEAALDGGGRAARRGGAALAETLLRLALAPPAAYGAHGDAAEGEQDAGVAHFLGGVVNTMRVISCMCLVGVPAPLPAARRPPCRRSRLPASQPLVVGLPSARHVPALAGPFTPPFHPFPCRPAPTASPCPALLHPPPPPPRRTRTPLQTSCWPTASCWGWRARSPASAR